MQITQDLEATRDETLEFFSLGESDLARSYYTGVHYEKNGHLEFVHSETGVRTLRDELDTVAAHNAKHLGQIRAALGRP